MSTVGIVRRIDELGRIVIPKEIRKTLRIKEGDPLEIFADKDALVFKKFSPVNSVATFAVSVCESLKDLTEKTCYITDTDKVVAVSGGKKDSVDAPISKSFEKVMTAKKSVVINRADGGEILSVFNGDDSHEENQIIVPIVSNGDCYGAVVLSDKDKNAKFTASDMKLAQLVAMTLAKQFE